MDTHAQLQAVLQAPPGEPPHGISVAESLKILEEHECWTPYQAFAEAANTVETLTSLATIQNQQQNDTQKAVHTLQNLITHHQLSASEFMSATLPKVTSSYKPAQQVDILSGIWKSFSQKHDQIICCEVMTTILEKQLRHSHSLQSAYRQLLDLDPQNSKALHFFKSTYRQEENWVEMAKICEDLLQIKQHPAEEQRIAHEYAAVLLYHLGDPLKTLEVLASYHDSEMDHTTLKFEAWMQLKKWKPCLVLLEDLIEKSESDQEKSILYFRCAHIHEQRSHSQKAFLCYHKAATLYRDFYEVYEQWMRLALHEKNTIELESVLNAIEKTVPEEHRYFSRVQKLKHIICQRQHI